MRDAETYGRAGKAYEICHEKWAEGELGQEIKPMCLESRTCVVSLSQVLLEGSITRTLKRDHVSVKTSDSF